MNLEALRYRHLADAVAEKPAPHGISQQNRSDPRRHRHRYPAARSRSQLHLAQWHHLACRSADCDLRRAQSGTVSWLPFLHALPAATVAATSHDCQVLIVGGDDVSYGSKPKDAANWREKLQGEVSLDPARVHFLGRIPYDSYRKVLQISAAHVYLTYPFVLSWSMLEAMASGCLVIGSATPPVQEVIRHQRKRPAGGFLRYQRLGQRHCPHPATSRAISKPCVTLPANRHICCIPTNMGWRRICG
jgi:glycosyltransferase involved in cell wall biosynthesis